MSIDDESVSGVPIELTGGSYYKYLDSLYHIIGSMNTYLLYNRMIELKTILTLLEHIKPNTLQQK